MFLVRLAATLAFMSFSTALFAQSPKIVVDAAGTCPEPNVLRSFPRVTQPSVGVGTTLAKLPGVKIYRSDDRNDAILQTIPFNAQLLVYGFGANEKRLFVKVLRSAEDAITAACGWVAAEAILLPRSRKFENRGKYPQPLQMKDISKSQEVAQNLLNVKAVVHNLSITGNASGIDIFEDPAEQKQKGKIKLFDAFLVFDEMVLPATSSGQETRYWLIGEQNKTEVAGLKGWIRQRDVVIWPSRLAVAWSENATVSGFATPENLERKAGDLVIGERLERSDYPEEITRRLPVLEQSPSPDRVAAALPNDATLEQRRSAAQDIIRYYKIATPGRACLKDSPADCLSARQIDSKRQQVATAERASMKIDVLILIDATESMDPYLPSMVRTIETFLNQAGDEKVRSFFDLRVGLATYGDYQGEDANYTKVDYTQVVPFFQPQPGIVAKMPTLQQLLNTPKNFIYKDVHKDRLEAPFAAAIRAARSTVWRPAKEVPLRFIVHVGDAGNRAKGMTSAQSMSAILGDVDVGRPPQSTVRETYGEDDVTAAMKAMGVIYLPLAIKQGTGLNPAPTPWNLAFEKQANTILARLGIDAPLKKAEQSFAGDPSSKLEQTVINAVGMILVSVRGSIEKQKCQKESTLASCKDSDGEVLNKPEIVNLVNRVSSVAAGLTSQEIENIYSRDQSIVTMYSPARSVERREMFTHWVALERKEFKMVRDLLKTLCSSMSQSDGRSPVNAALEKFAEAYSNESLSGLTVSEILGKRLGIPNLERTDLSGRSREEIDDAYRAWQNGEKATWENWHMRSCKAMHFTQLMEDDKRTDIDKIACDLGNSTCRVSDAAVRKFRWNVEVSLDSPTYYVPLDILP